MVKRSGIFIGILLSLFMFQSLWNVAAAFCTHENRKDVPTLGLKHFGHHVALSCQKDDQHDLEHADLQKTNNNKQLLWDQTISSTSFDQNLKDDHRDHLPSFSHFMVIDVQQEADKPHFSINLRTLFMDWNNLYQSPHLFLPNPPPVYSPL